MSPRFCEHLEEYGSLYTRVEASYLQCNDLVARILSEGADAELVESLTVALDEWLLAGQELRSALVDLVADGRVLIPKMKPHARKRHGSFRCSKCRFEIPTLKFSDWQFAGNGTVSFQGEDFSLGKPVAVE